MLAVVIAGAFLSPASAAELGMKAPPLTIAEWVKGKPVDLKAGEGKNVYVVEFWATWCQPCRTSIPHLSDLQKKFKDKGVVFVGISSGPTPKVKPFVEKRGYKMAYTVAVDEARNTAAAYMAAFNVETIPHAFVVDKAGKIVWHGHPMDKLDTAVENAIAGKSPKSVSGLREGLAPSAGTAVQ